MTATAVAAADLAALAVIVAVGSILTAAAVRAWWDDTRRARSDLVSTRRHRRARRAGAHICTRTQQKESRHV